MARIRRCAGNRYLANLSSMLPAVPWLLVLAGPAESYFGALGRFTGADLEAGVRLYRLAGIVIATGGTS